MKRSQIIKLIANQIEVELYDFPDGFSGYDTTAEIILTYLEQAGMLPPKAPMKVGEETKYDYYWEKE